jgi:predicted dehydrogenase
MRSTEASELINENSSGRKIRVGLVGVGSFGNSFVRLFRDHPFVERIALCDVDRDRLERAAGEFAVADTFDSLESLCRADHLQLDAVALFTQPWLHAPQAIAALESGKHVYSAVPIISLDDGNEMLEWCARLIDTCRRTGRHYMMGETSYFRPQAVYCRQQAAKGAFGRFVLAEGEYFHDIDDPRSSLREVAQRRWGAAWGPRKRGGVPMHYPTHSIGGLLSVMAAVDNDSARLTEVSAIGHAYADDDWFSPDTESGNTLANETALFRCANGAAVRICEYRRIGHAGREAFSLFGTDAGFREGADGRCHWTTKHGAAELSTTEMRAPLPAEVMNSYRRGAAAETGRGIYGGHGGSHAYLVDEFVRAIATGRRPAMHAWEAARCFVPGIIAHQSALRDGELLKIPDFGSPPVER